MRVPTPQPVAATAPSRDAPSYRDGRAILGNLRAFRSDPLDLLIAAHAECGDVVRIPFGRSYDLYSVRHPDAVQRVLVDNAHAYIKGRAFDWLRRGSGVGLLTADGDDARWRRTVLGPGFGRAQIAATMPLVERGVERTADDWSNRVGTTVEIHDEMSDLALRIVTRMLFGVDLEAAEHRSLRGAFKDGAETVRELLGTLSQFVPALPTPINRAAKRQRAALDQHIDHLMDARLAEGEGADLMSRMLVGMKAGGMRSGLRAHQSRSEMRDELILLVGAGHETVGTLLATTWLLIAQHTEVEQRLHRELEGEHGEVYVRQVIAEALRLKPPTWGILREAARDDVVGGVRIPAGSFVVVSPYLVHRDPRFWRDAERFDPDRHTGEANGDRPRWSYLPFGAGPRACIGQMLVDVESVAALATLAKRFRLRLEGSVEYAASLTYRPVNGTRMRIEAR